MLVPFFLHSFLLTNTVTILTWNTVPSSGEVVINPPYLSLTKFSLKLYSSLMTPPSAPLFLPCMFVVHYAHTPLSATIFTVRTLMNFIPSCQSYLYPDLLLSAPLLVICTQCKSLACKRPPPFYPYFVFFFSYMFFVQYMT